MVILLPLILLVSNAAGEYGVDTSNWGKPWTAAQLACLRQADQRFLIVEAFRRSERVLPDARTTVVNARAAGFDDGDVQLYHFPDAGMSPEAQVESTIEYFADANRSAPFFLWLDVEGTQYWSPNCTNNTAFLHAMVGAARARLGDNNVGIYSSKSQWVPITCDDASFSRLPLWRPHYDGRADNDDWTEAAIGPFGGWKVGDVAMKQFNGTTQMCGINVDLDWRFHTTARR